MSNEPIDVESEMTGEYTPSTAAPLLTRSEVLTSARVVAAAVTGLSALVEQLALQPGTRGEFVEAWRQWAGTWLGYHLYIERMPFNLEVVKGEVSRYARALEVWREGLRHELRVIGVVLGQSMGASTPAPVVQSRPEGLFGRWPWWATASVTLGLGYGSYKVVQYIISGWTHRHDDNQ